MIDLSIIIVNWNTADLLQDCIESIIASTSGITYEIIVVDNGSSDHSRAMVRDRFPSVRLIANASNLGFARANNQGIQVSCGRYIQLLNSDTLIDPGALTALVGFLDAHPQVGIAGPRLLNGDGTLQRSWAQFPTFWSEIKGINVRLWRRFLTCDGTEAYSVDWVGGACLLIRRETITQVGMLDEHFFMYSEETDWCFRARQAGWEICYYPNAQVIHFGGQSSRQASVRMKAELYRSKLRFFAKHYGARPTWSLGLILQALFLSRALLGWLIYLGSLRRWRRALTSHNDAITMFRTVNLQLHSYHQ
jgi:GT2 family glycosyltransferase